LREIFLSAIFTNDGIVTQYIFPNVCPLQKITISIEAYKKSRIFLWNRLRLHLSQLFISQKGQIKKALCSRDPLGYFNYQTFAIKYFIAIIEYIFERVC
jgi:hypothetical protein